MSKENKNKNRNRNKNNQEEVQISDPSSDISGETEEEVDLSEQKKIFIKKLKIFKMIHENECDDGKDLSKDQRKDKLEELEAAYRATNNKLPLKNYIINVSRWTSYESDMDHWQIWDEKEEMMNNYRKKRRDRIRDRDRRRQADKRSRNKSRSKSRSRSRSRDRQKRNSKYHGHNSDDDGKQKDHVK